MKTATELLLLAGYPLRLSMADTCRAIGISTYTGWEWRRKGIWPFPLQQGPSGRQYVDIRDIGEYLDRCAAEAREEFEKDRAASDTI